MVLLRNAAPAILVVDDEPETVHLLHINLTARGYEVTATRSGPEALQAFDRRYFDLVIIDVFLPGMDGYEVCRRLREMSASVGIILMSARYARERDEEAALELGANRYLSKPFGIDELLSHMEAVLNEMGG